MNVLFTADWHIKLTQKNVPTEWSINRFNLMVDKIIELSKEGVDLVVIGGDVFDRVPNLQELEIFFNFVRRCVVDTVIYAGNHEAVKKNTTFFSHLVSTVNLINPKVAVITEAVQYKGLDVLPYNCLKDFAESPDKYFPEPNRILLTHVRGEIPPHVKPEVPLELFDKWELVLAGDLHSHSNSQRNIVYPGSPVTTSFHRDLVTTYVVILDTDTLEYSTIELDLPQLLKKTVKPGDPIEPGVFHHVIYEVEGTVSELAAVTQSELVGKVITRKAVDTALILSPSMSLVDEAVEYMRYILELDDKTIAAAIDLLKDTVKE